MNDNAIQLQISYPQIWKMALPIAFSMFIPQINYFVNNYFISHLGEFYLASYTICGMYYLFFAVLGMSLNTGLQALIGKALGEKNNPQATNFFYNASTLCLYFSFFGIIFTFLFIQPILQLFIHQQHIIQIAVPFLKIRILGLPFLYLYLLRNSLFINLNKSNLLILISIVETFVNILFDYLLIFGNFHFPALGVFGAAWASIIAEIIGFVVSYLFIQFNVKKKFPISYKLSWNTPIIKNILSYSSPIIFQHFFAIFGWQIFFVFVENMGQRDLAISGVMKTIIGILGLIPWTFSFVTNTLISNLVGQGKTHLIYQGIKKLILSSFCLSTLIILLVYAQAPNIISNFNHDPLFVHTSTHVLNVLLLTILVMSIAAIGMNTIIGIGKSKIVLYMEIVAVLAYIFYIYWIIKLLKMSIVWAWTSEILYWTLMLLMAYSYLLYFKKNNATTLHH